MSEDVDVTKFKWGIVTEYGAKIMKLPKHSVIFYVNNGIKPLIDISTGNTFSYNGKCVGSSFKFKSSLSTDIAVMPIDSCKLVETETNLLKEQLISWNDKDYNYCLKLIQYQLYDKLWVWEYSQKTLIDKNVMRFDKGIMLCDVYELNRLLKSYLNIPQNIWVLKS